jgi:hydrogenase maturation protein HypF
LFDAVAALLDLCQQITFEGQAAMALEFAADGTVGDAYHLPLVAADALETGGMGQWATAWARRSDLLVLDWRPMVKDLLTDLQEQLPAGIIAARFHNALVEAIVAVAHRVGERRVALSGGCFQNRWLTERSAQRLSDAGFEVLLHSQVPPNDGCISLGQVAVAAARMGR